MRRLMVGLVALVAFGLVGGYVAGAATRPTSPALASTQGNLAVIAVVRSGPQSAVDVAAPLVVSSAELVVTVPDGKQDLFDVRFSGVVSYPDGPSFPVTVDVTVNGIAMPPSALPAWPSGASSPIPFQLERAIGPLISGTYHIRVQLTGANANDHRPLQLLGWTLLSQRTSENATDRGPAV